MIDSFDQEHSAILSMLEEGSQALIVAPRLISGWRGGRVKKISIWSQDADYREGSHNLDPCGD